MTRHRLVLCTNGGLHGALVMKRLLAAPHLEVCALVISTRVRARGQGFWRSAWTYLRGSGLRYTLYLWASTTLADLLLRFTPEGPVARMALRVGIPVLATPEVNDATALRFIVGAAPDFLLSAFFNQRIGEAVARTPRVGTLNIHPAELPAWRGVDPVFFAELEGNAFHSVSVHEVTTVLDGGALVAVAAGIARSGSVLSTTAGLYDRGASLFVRSLHAPRGTGTQQASGGRYDSWPTPAQVAAFRRRGGRLTQPGDLWRLACRGTDAFVIESEP